MKIAIIGAGWVGCHLANILKNKYKINIFSKNGEIFNEASIYNQNRLHLGYHYARSHATRELCLSTFNKFLLLYGHLTANIKNNLYAIPLNNSNIDFITYLKIFNNINHSIVDANLYDLNNIEGCIEVNEKYINPIDSKKYFQQKLNQLIIDQYVSNTDLIDISKKYDIVINCTNNFLNSNYNKTYLEKCLMLIYEKKTECKFGALTLVDGPLFSIYPYINNTVTLSHVLYTPISKNKNFNLNSKIDLDIKKQKKLMEKDVLKYFKNFYDFFQYKDYFISHKMKKETKCDDRTPVITINNNIINCYTGKIQGIFFIEKFIENEISNWK